MVGQSYGCGFVHPVAAGIEADVLDAVGRRFEVLWPELTERGRRWLLAVEARELGWGGAAAMAQVAGLARSTVTAGMAELDSP
jgi:hypothetical protein